MKLISDDIVYLVWTIMFLSVYGLVTGSTASYASTKFVSLIYKSEK